MLETMNLSIFYWVILLVWFLGAGAYNRNGLGSWAVDNVPVLLLFVILGLKIFGSPLR